MIDRPKRVCTCKEPIRLSMGVCGHCCGRLPKDELLNFAEAIVLLAEKEK